MAAEIQESIRLKIAQGVGLASQGDLQGAKTCFQEAQIHAAINQDLELGIEAQCNLGTALFHLGDLQGAIAQLEEVVKIGSMSPFL